MFTVPTAAIHLTRRYRFPVCAEWDVCKPGGHARMQGNLDIQLKVASAEPLSDVLQRLAAVDSAHYDFQYYYGVPVLVALGKATDRMNALDTPIDLDLDGVSLWQALQAAQAAINSRVPEAQIPLASVFCFQSFGLLKAHLPQGLPIRWGGGPPTLECRRSRGVVCAHSHEPRHVLVRVQELRYTGSPGNTRPLVWSSCYCQRPRP